jgi:hypothetical protein
MESECGVVGAKKGPGRLEGVIRTCPGGRDGLMYSLRQRPGHCNDAQRARVKRLGGRLVPADHQAQFIAARR